MTVHIVPHSHDDVGWLKTVDEYFDTKVDSILTTVVDALLDDPKRKFSQVEMKFFSMWFY